ncbi:MAG TPA: hypothetical protein VF187_09510, partial [Gemmatimonadales bacterium]
NLPLRFRGGAFLTWFSGDRVTPTLTISDLLLEFELPDSTVGPPRLPKRIRGYFFQTIAGQRIFVQPRGTYRYPGRASLDLHLERSFDVGRMELRAILDAFNTLGAGTVTGIQTSINGNLDPEDFSAYGQTLQRVPPRTLRIGVAVKY